MTRRNASGTVLMTLGLMAVALGVAPSDACAQCGNCFFPNEFFGGPNGDFPMPNGYGGGYYYDGPFNDWLTWSPWGDDDDGDDDDPWDGDHDFDGPKGGGRASQERAVGVQLLRDWRARDAAEAAQIME